MKAITILENEEYLRQISSEVDLNDPNLKEELKIIENYCIEHDVLAMAAVQLGIPKRLVYLKCTSLEALERKNSEKATEEDKNYNEAKVLINPVITSRIGITDYWEACASCLDNFGHVRRPYKLVLDYYDIDGNKHTDVFEGFEATVLSHEMDHLDGILHMDIADELLQMEQEERKLFRKEHGYNIISKTGIYENLLKEKNKNLVYKK